MRRADFAITPSPPPPSPVPGPSTRTKGWGRGGGGRKKERKRTGKENACCFIKIRKAVATVLGVVKGDGASVS